MLDYIHKAAARLDKARMLRYNDATGDLVPTNLGRTASYFYINVNTVETINSLMMPNMTEAEILRLLSQASEFEQIQVIAANILSLLNLAFTLSCWQRDFHIWICYCCFSCIVSSTVQ